MILGISDAVINPSVNKFLTIWFPKEKRTMALGAASCGRQLAVLAAFPIAGVFCSRGHWPFVFYFSGILGISWSFLWFFFVFKEKKPKIQEAPEGALEEAPKKAPKIPWMALLNSTALWANVGAIFCHEIPSAFIFVFMPNFFRDVLHYDVEAVGILSAIPAGVFLFTKLFSAKLL